MYARVLACLIAVLGIAGVAAYVQHGRSQPESESETERREHSRDVTPSARTSADDHSDGKLVPVPVLPPPPHYAARQFEVVFRNGESVHVVAKRPLIANPPYMPTERFLDQYAALVSRARAGDAAAARMIFRALKTCERARKARQGEPAADPSSNSTRRYCEGVDDDHLRDASSWAELASDGGDPLGRQDWALELQSLGRGEESVKQLQAIWQDGHIGVLQALASAYRKGLASDGVPDHSNAYAYFYIRYKLAEAGGSGTPSQRGRLDAMEEARRSLGGFLNPGEQELAETQAMRLLRENTACCIGNP